MREDIWIRVYVEVTAYVRGQGAESGLTYGIRRMAGEQSANKGVPRVACGVREVDCVSLPFSPLALRTIPLRVDTF